MAEADSVAEAEVVAEEFTGLVTTVAVSLSASETRAEADNVERGMAVMSARIARRLPTEVGIVRVGICRINWIGRLAEPQPAPPSQPGHRQELLTVAREARELTNMDAHALCRQWQDFAGGFPRTATGDGVAGTDGLAEPPPLHDLAHHRRLLDRVLYKTRNSHRATAYYQQLHAVQRLLRRLQRLVDEPAFLLAGDQDEDAPSANHAMVLSNLAVMSALTTAILGACERAYVSLRAIAGQQYFLPFALIAMSIVARIANCMRIVVGGQLTRMEAVAVEISTVVRAVDNEDVGGEQ